MIEIRRSGFDVYLRQLNSADAPYVYVYSQNPLIYEFMPWGAPESVDDVRAFITEAMHRSDLELGSDFGIHRIKDDLLLGVVSLADISRRHRSAEIGYWLAKKFWNNGYMYQGQVLLLRYAFEELELHRLQAKVSPRNLQSIRSLQRLGFTLEGTMREDAWWKGAYHTHQTWSLLSTDPQPKLRRGGTTR